MEKNYNSFIIKEKNNIASNVFSDSDESIESFKLEKENKIFHAPKHK